MGKLPPDAPGELRRIGRLFTPERSAVPGLTASGLPMLFARFTHQVTGRRPR
jgi:hypothetical protein